MNDSNRKLIGCTLLFFATLVAGYGDADGAPPSKPFHSASWVWSDLLASQNDQGNEPRYLRRAFVLSAKPTAGELLITADNNYTVYINGKKVGQDSTWSSVETFDVAKHLRQGPNVLAIVATKPSDAPSWST